MHAIKLANLQAFCVAVLVAATLSILSCDILSACNSASALASRFDNCTLSDDEIIVNSPGLISNIEIMN